MHILTSCRSSMIIFPYGLIGDIHERIYDYKDATRLLSWLFIDSSCTLNHIPMVLPISCPSYCTIIRRQSIVLCCLSCSQHKSLTFKLHIYFRLDEIKRITQFGVIPKFYKYLMQDNRPREIISQPGLSRINALSRMNHLACRSKDNHSLRI